LAPKRGGCYDRFCRRRQQVHYGGKEIDANGTGRELQQRVWRIRNSIETLEQVKDRIVSFLQKQTDLDEATKGMWVGDAKEAYYSVVAAWQMLDAVTRGNEKAAGSSQNFLKAAQSRHKQVLSELGSFGDDSASDLASAFQEAFEACRSAMVAELKPFVSKDEQGQPPSQPVMKINRQEYHMPCSVCGRKAVEFRVGKSRWGEQECLAYTGITKYTELPLEQAEEVFSLLQQSDLAGLHGLVRKKKMLEDGVDAYCPNCDRIYCRTHYNVSEEWDEGFYDFSYGTCPKGHKRIIDD
jgi:hypothetical protein